LLALLHLAIGKRNAIILYVVLEDSNGTSEKEVQEISCKNASLLYEVPKKGRAQAPPKY